MEPLTYRTKCILVISTLYVYQIVSKFEMHPYTMYIAALQMNNNKDYSMKIWITNTWISPTKSFFWSSE